MLEFPSRKQFSIFNPFSLRVFRHQRYPKLRIFAPNWHFIEISPPWLTWPFYQSIWTYHSWSAHIKLHGQSLQPSILSARWHDDTVISDSVIVGYGQGRAHRCYCHAKSRERLVCHDLLIMLGSVTPLYPSPKNRSRFGLSLVFCSASLAAMWYHMTGVVIRTSWHTPPVPCGPMINNLHFLPSIYRPFCPFQKFLRSNPAKQHKFSPQPVNAWLLTNKADRTKFKTMHLWKVSQLLHTDRTNLFWARATKISEHSPKEILGYEHRSTNSSAVCRLITNFFFGCGQSVLFLSIS